MIVNLICNLVLLAILVVFVILYIVYIVKVGKRSNCISFKESMDLTELPIITFYNNTKKLNFLLDTGANVCVINHKDLDNLSYKSIEDTSVVFGMNGESIEVGMVTIDLLKDDVVYTGEFQVIDMSNAFDKVKAESGVTVHGVLGTRFFEKYKYVLDFDKLAAYSIKQ